VHKHNTTTAYSNTTCRPAGAPTAPFTPQHVALAEARLVVSMRDQVHVLQLGAKSPDFYVTVTGRATGPLGEGYRKTHPPVAYFIIPEVAAEKVLVCWWPLGRGPHPPLVTQHRLRGCSFTQVLSPARARLPLDLWGL
jgi:hypothetical protein